jgi:hypothetical protein
MTSHDITFLQDGSVYSTDQPPWVWNVDSQRSHTNPAIQPSWRQAEANDGIDRTCPPEKGCNAHVQCLPDEYLGLGRSKYCSKTGTDSPLDSSCLIILPIATAWQQPCSCSWGISPVLRQSQTFREHLMGDIFRMRGGMSGTTRASHKGPIVPMLDFHSSRSCDRWELVDSVRDLRPRYCMDCDKCAAYRDSLPAAQQAYWPCGYCPTGCSGRLLCRIFEQLSSG